MPRPKVKPQDRQRSVRACDACKASKKRCDAIQPCRLCLKKGTQDTCTYTPTARDKRSRHLVRQAAAATTTTATVSPVAAEDSPTDFRSILTGSTQRSRHHFDIDERSLAEQQEEDVPNEDADSETEENPGSRNSVDRSTQEPVMLSSSSGDKVFVGNTAALSFLRFLQRTLKHYIGPSGFTNRQHSHSLFELASSDADGEMFHNNLSQAEKLILIRCFLDASSGFLDLYTQDELTQLVDLSEHPEQATSASPAQPTSDRTALASLYLMIAIGAQVRGNSKDDVVRASKYFAQGRKMAFEKWLEDPTVSLIRTFVLMAFYMFGACRRNSAFMYLGVAAKSADILGLHVASQNRHMPKTERDSRLRVAKSIRVFDIICSSILGRRSSAPQLRSIDVSPGDMEQDPPSPGSHRALALRATYESCSILETVVGKFADDGSLTTVSAEHYLQLLREWSQVLPPALRQRPRRGDDVREQEEEQGGDNENNAHHYYRETMISNVHVAGTYYFGIILVTRQFLIQHVVPQLRGGQATRRAHSSRQGMGEEDESGRTIGELSRACIEAATYMAQMCREAVDAGVLLGNMCIIKAWAFAAGLVLGFSLLADDPSDGDTREAFRGAQHVLRTLGRLSAQAAQYHQILAAFAEAIDVYRRQKRSEQRHESRVPFVEQILVSYNDDDDDGDDDDDDDDQQQHHHRHHSNDAATTTSSSFSGVSGNHNHRVVKRTGVSNGGGGGDEGGGGVFDQFIHTRGNIMVPDHTDLCANVDVLGQQQQQQQQDRAFLLQQEMGVLHPSSSQSQQQQLPTPDMMVDEQVPLMNDGRAGGTGYWNQHGSDNSLSMLSDLLAPPSSDGNHHHHHHHQQHQQCWPPPLLPEPDNNELMLRLLWDGYAMGFDLDPAASFLQQQQHGPGAAHLDGSFRDA